MPRIGVIAAVFVASLGIGQAARAQNTVYFPNTVYMPAILELSGAGAVSGTNFRDGMILAIEEINAKGGILGKKIERRARRVSRARKCRRSSTTSRTSSSGRCSPDRC